MQKKRFFALLLSLSLTAMILSACGAPDPAPTPVEESAPSTSPTISSAPTSNPVVEGAYPAPTTVQEEQAPYPAPEFNTEPPEVDFELPETESDRSSAGGVLIRNTVAQGFVPLSPVAIFLGEIVYMDDGTPAFMSSSESGYKAALFNTGVFIFQNIPPGTYGLVVDMGFGQFPVRDTDGSMFMFTLEPGEAVDLGMVEVELPGDG